MNSDQDGTTAGPSIPEQRSASADGARRCGPTPLDLPGRRTVPAPRSAHRAVPAGEQPTWVRDRERSEVLHRHARLGAAGRPVFCTPSRAEIAGVVALRQGRGTDGKVIYDTREAAESAARELEALGARTLRSYLCGRSRRGHFHLATAGRGAVPRQRSCSHGESHVDMPYPRPAENLFDRIPHQRGA